MEAPAAEVRFSRLGIAWPRANAPISTAKNTCMYMHDIDTYYMYLHMQNYLVSRYIILHVLSGNFTQFQNNYVHIFTFYGTHNSILKCTVGINVRWGVTWVSHD